MTTTTSRGRVTTFVRGAALVGVLALGGTAFAGSHDVTLLLRSGERVTGEFASFDQSTVDIRDTDGQRHAVPFDDVVLMDFRGAARTASRDELDQARGAGQLLVMYNGQIRTGRIVDFVDEGGPTAAVVFESSEGRREQIPLNDTDRLYVHQMTAEASKVVGVANDAPSYRRRADRSTDRRGGTIEVPATQQWVDSGIDVNRGDRLAVTASGTIYLRGGRQLPASPAGASDRSRAADGPMPDLLAGALIGRIGTTGEPFGIGDQRSISAPASGRLYLGVNDGQLSDNEGSFSVRLTDVDTVASRDQ